MDPIYEAYDQTINESVILTAILAALATGAILKLVDKRKKDGPKFVDWLAAFIEWGLSDGEEAMDIRDIKKAAYRGYDEFEFGEPIAENLIEEGSNISTKLKSLKKKGGTAFNKAKGEILGRIIKYAQLPKSTIDKVLNAAKA